MVFYFLRFKICIKLYMRAVRTTKLVNHLVTYNTVPDQRRYSREFGNERRVRAVPYSRSLVTKCCCPHRLTPARRRAKQVAS